MIFLISMLTTTIGSIVDGIIVSKAMSSAAIAALAIGSAYNKFIFNSKDFFSFYSGIVLLLFAKG